MTLDVPTPFKSVTWDFGNGVTQTGPTVTYAYPVPGTYTVTVTASGRDKTQSTTAFMVNVEP
jgi:PKD repeat protein